eukprot:1325396-Alexandrium_andersonii.AAC.1
MPLAPTGAERLAPEADISRPSPGGPAARPDARAAPEPAGGALCCGGPVAHRDSSAAPGPSA